MFSKFSALTAVLVTLVALSGLQGVSAEPTCNDEEFEALYCCMFGTISSVNLTLLTDNSKVPPRFPV